MNLTFHLIKKDARRLAWPLALWLALVAAEPLFGLWLAHAPDWVWDEFDGIVIYHRLLVALQIAACLVLTARLVQDDSLVDSRAFWPTRPISRACLLRAKLAALVGFFWLPPLLILLPWWLSSGLGFGEIANVALETVLRQAAITLPAWLLASITLRLGSFFVRSAALVVAVLAANVWWFSTVENFDQAEAVPVTWSIPPAFLAPAANVPATNVSGFDLRPGPARLVGLQQATILQLQVVVDRSQPFRVVYPLSSNIVWNSPVDRDLAASMLFASPRGSFQSLLVDGSDGPPLETLVAQLLGEGKRFALPLGGLLVASHIGPVPVTPVNLRSDSRHDVAIKVKLMVWEVANLAMAPLLSTSTPADRRLSVLGSQFHNSGGVDAAPRNLTLTLAGRGPAPAKSLFGAFYNEGEWNMPSLVVLVNRARTGFFFGFPTTPDADRHLRISGVGLDFRQRGFENLLREYPWDAVVARPPKKIVPADGEFGAFDLTWESLQGAMVVTPEFKPLGWIEREAKEAEIVVLGERIDRWQLEVLADAYREAATPALAAAYPELEADSKALLTAATNASLADETDPAGTVQLYRDYTNTFDRVIARLHTLAQGRGEAASSLGQFQLQSMTDRLTSIRREQP